MRGCWTCVQGSVHSHGAPAHREGGSCPMPWLGGQASQSAQVVKPNPEKQRAVSPLSLQFSFMEVTE